MMRTLCRELANTIPSLKRVNRGKMSSYDVGEKAVELGADKVLIIDRWKGRPGRMRLFEVKEGLSQIPPQLYVRGVKFRRDFNVKRRPPGNVFIQESGGAHEIRRLIETFSRFFELPALKMNDAGASQRSTVMRISKEPAENVIRLTFYKMPRNVEVGPRIRFSHAVWEI